MLSMHYNLKYKLHCTIFTESIKTTTILKCFNSLLSTLEIINQYPLWIIVEKKEASCKF